MKLKDLLTKVSSRKFLLALVSAFIAFGNSLWDWGISESELWGILVPVLAFMGVEGILDYKRISKSNKN